MVEFCWVIVNVVKKRVITSSQSSSVVAVVNVVAVAVVDVVAVVAVMVVVVNVVFVGVALFRVVEAIFFVTCVQRVVVEIRKTVEIIFVVVVVVIVIVVVFVDIFDNPVKLCDSGS